MPKQSAGILLYRFVKSQIEVFLVHPGGPFFKNKDLGSWSIPKGEFLDDEEPLLAAMREFKEETGFTVNGEFVQLHPVKLKSGKVIHAWALQGDVNAEEVVSNTFQIHWPPSSGRMVDFPEVDRGGWFTITIAKNKVNPAQIALIDELQQLLIKG